MTSTLPWKSVKWCAATRKAGGHDRLHAVEGRPGVVARYAAALGGRLHQAIYFDDGDISAIA
jgi:hypothetical protein